jgi:precorrin-2 dehydrogenase / sirohydrochlorin ferrochelatase
MASRAGRPAPDLVGSLYPVNLVLRGKPCLVVGAGRVAAQKIRGLQEAGAAVHVVAPDLSEEVRALAGITTDQRPYRAGDVVGYWLVITCTNDPEVNGAVHADGEANRVWVNSADDPSHCSVLLPSRIRRGPLLVTFSTSGEAPAVAKWLRRAYEGEFGGEYVTLIELVAEQRHLLQAEGRSTEGVSWQKALDSGTLGLIREGHLAEAKERLQACLSSSSD